MSYPNTDRVRGELLREWRASQHVDAAALAQSANLSVAQIRQLELGGTSLFYTPAIKEMAARKVARLLGGDPDSVIRMSDDVTVLGSVPSVVEDLVTLSGQKTHESSAWSVLARHPVLLYMPIVVLLGVFASSWLQQKWQNGGKQQFWPNAAAQVTQTPPVLTVPVTPLQVNSQVAPADPQPVAVAAMTVPVPVLSRDLQTRAPQNAQAALGTLVSESESVLPVGAGLCQNTPPETVLTPSSPSKAGDMVHIVAHKPGDVCVVDAAGLRTHMSLKANESRSVYGAPPWRVHFELPEQAQLYFQGVRLRVPNPQFTTVALREGARRTQ